MESTERAFEPLYQQTAHEVIQVFLNHDLAVGFFIYFAILGCQPLFIYKRLVDGTGKVSIFAKVFMYNPVIKFGLLWRQFKKGFMRVLDFWQVYYFPGINRVTGKVNAIAADGYRRNALLYG